MDENLTTKLDLASVAKTVAETDRRRAIVQEKLSQAQSVIEALDAESKSLQESVLELKRDPRERRRNGLARSSDRRPPARDRGPSCAHRCGRRAALGERAQVGVDRHGA